MADRYRIGHPRPRSPVYNPARASLPINLSGFGYPAAHEHHFHIIPTSRRENIQPHSRTTNVTGNAGTITTTYKVHTDPPPRSNSAQLRERDASRRRSATIENPSRPTIVTTVESRHKAPVVHSAGIRPGSPMQNTYRSSDEDYYAVPAATRHAHSHHKRNSATINNSDMNRLMTEREGNRLRAGTGREAAGYIETRPRSSYPALAARHADTVGDDYGDDGYGYTNPRDLVAYDLDTTSSRQRPRRDSFDGRTTRPNSITGYADVAPRSFDTRERGPPPSTRGFDRISRGATWEQPSIRMPVASIPSMDIIQRPSRTELPFEEQPVRRSSSRRPASLYYDREREQRRGSRDDFYEVRDEDLRERKSHRVEPRFESSVEQRGFGIRAEAPPPRPERPDRTDRIDRPERAERLERSDRHEKSQRSERTERSDRSEDDRSDYKSGRDVLKAGLGIAAGALGLKAVKNARDDRDDRDRERDDRDERDERRRKDYDDEPRRRREQKEDRESADIGARDLKERRHRDDNMDRTPPPPRDIPPPSRENTLPPREAPPAERDDRIRRSPEPILDLGGRNLRERPASQNDRGSDPETRERRNRSEVSGSKSDSRSDSASDAIGILPRQESRISKEVGAVSAAPAAFNPKDTMDLKALKEALNSKDTSAPKEAQATSAPLPRTSQESMTKDVNEIAQIRKELDERKPRDPVTLTENSHPRVVSPPRPKPEEKPVKGILRAPREKFPEDPSPIREGVAPLKDAKKDGVPPDARWTKISRKLVNPEALELGKERYEARDDFVIVLRVLSRDEVQGYAEVTQKLRAAREEDEELETREQRRRDRRDRHERHKRERSRGERSERNDRRRRRERDSESDTTEDDDRENERESPKLLEAAPSRRRANSTNFDDVLMSGGINTGGLKENPNVPGQYLNYTRNPPPSSSLVTQSSGPSRK